MRTVVSALSPAVRVAAPPPTGRRGEVERAARLANLAREIQACRRCPLGAQRTRAVIYRGDPDPQVVFVGEAPGREEDRTGVPFVGRSGQVLDRAIVSLDLAPTEYGVLNVLKCRPAGNRFDRAAARTCRPFLDRQLALLGPRGLVSLGAHALRSLVPDAPPMLAAAGTPLASPFGPVFPLLHPAATLRSRRFAARWLADIVTLRSWLESARR